MIQDLLRRPARVHSTDSITGRPISLAVADSGDADVEPSTALLSMLRPDAVPSLLAPDGAPADDVVPAACGPINFFGWEETGRAFTERVQGTFLLAIEQEVELVRLINGVLFGSALADPGRWFTEGRRP